MRNNNTVAELVLIPSAVPIEIRPVLESGGYVYPGEGDDLVIRLRLRNNELLSLYRNSINENSEDRQFYTGNASRTGISIDLAIFFSSLCAVSSGYLLFSNGNSNSDFKSASALSFGLCIVNTCNLVWGRIVNRRSPNESLVNPRVSSAVLQRIRDQEQQPQV